MLLCMCVIVIITACYCDPYQLATFLQQRLRELNSTEITILTSSLFLTAPRIVQLQSVDRVEHWLADVQKVLVALRNPRIQQLIMIRSSKRLLTYFLSCCAYSLTRVYVCVNVYTYMSEQ